MYRTSASPIYNSNFLEDVLNAYLFGGTIHPVLTPEVRLLKAGITPDRFSTVADLAAFECDFSGYAASTVAPIQGPWSLDPNTIGALLDGWFNVTSPATIGNNVKGYWVQDPASLFPVVVELFQDEVPMSAAGDFLDVTVQIGLRVQIDY